MKMISILTACLGLILTGFGDIETTDEAVTKLGAVNFQDREDASHYLHAHAGPKLVPKLKMLAKDRDPEVAMRAKALLDFASLRLTVPSFPD